MLTQFSIKKYRKLLIEDIIFGEETELSFNPAPDTVYNMACLKVEIQNIPYFIMKLMPHATSRNLSLKLFQPGFYMPQHDTTDDITLTWDTKHELVYSPDHADFDEVCEMTIENAFKHVVEKTYPRDSHGRIFGVIACLNNFLEDENNRHLLFYRGESTYSWEPSNPMSLLEYYDLSHENDPAEITLPDDLWKKLAIIVKNIPRNDYAVQSPFEYDKLKKASAHEKMIAERYIQNIVTIIESTEIDELENTIFPACPDKIQKLLE